MRRKPSHIALSSSPARIGPLAAMCLLELALDRRIWLSESDLVEIERVIIDVITDLHDDLLALPDTEPSSD